VATFDEDRSEIAVFVVSRHLTDSVALSIGMRPFPGQWGVEHLVLADNDSRAVERPSPLARACDVSRRKAGGVGQYSSSGMMLHAASSSPGARERSSLLT
jgi:hypothetical protein